MTIKIFSDRNSKHASIREFFLQEIKKTLLVNSFQLEIQNVVNKPFSVRNSKRNCKRNW